MKVAIIGAGFGKYAVAPVFEKLGMETLVAWPRDEAEVAEAIASDADLVSVHSPPFLHVPHVMAAIEAGKHVLCDKPFGVSGAEAAHDVLLRGRPGRYRVLLDRTGSWIPGTWRRLSELRPGYDVYLPIKATPGGTGPA